MNDNLEHGAMYLSVISALRMIKQEDGKFDASLNYVENASQSNED